MLDRRDRALLWFVFLGPVAAWTLQLNVGYGYNEAACSNDTGVNLQAPLIGGVSLLLAAVAAAAGVAGVRTWRAVRRGDVADPRGRIAFMCVFGMLSAPIFVFLIVMSGVQVLILDPCAPS